ncbi:MAG: hypothetical protein HQL69_01380 [Magnetococcales bacterium]|nr:hypothetical protein [Magnetococcales bacterium]
MQESTTYQSTVPYNNIPLPLALNGILTPEEFIEQTEFGLLRGEFPSQGVVNKKPSIEDDLYHPYFVN